MFHFFSGVVLMEISEVHKKVQLELEESVSQFYFFFIWTTR